MIHKYGTTICSKGWDNVAQRPLLNKMFSCSSGNVFIGSIDTIGEGHMPIPYVMHWVDTSKPLESTTLIIQIYTDNVSSMRSVIDLLYIKEFVTLVVSIVEGLFHFENINFQGKANYMHRYHLAKRNVHLGLVFGKHFILFQNCYGVDFVHLDNLNCPIKR